MRSTASERAEGEGGTLRELVEAVPAVIYEAEPGPDGHWHYVSRELERLLGYSPQEWMADPSLYASRLHPDDREAVIRIEGRELEAARGGGVTAVSEYRMLHRDGSLVWVRDEARLAGYPEHPMWQGVLLDITAERALVDAYDRYRSLVESLPVCLYRSEPGIAGRWKFLTPQIEELLGYSASELMSDPELRVNLIHPADRDWVLEEESKAEAAASGAEWVREYRLMNRSGDPVWVRDRGAVSGTAGDRRTVEGILADISATHASFDPDTAVPDVYRLNCPRCGSVWAAERIEACQQCGNSDVDAVSLDATMRELTRVSAQLEGLLDGIQGHFEMLKTSLPEGIGELPSPAPRDRLRIVTPLHEDPDES